eukprot:PhF_6_TR31430/c0_g1_i1/m.46097
MKITVVVEVHSLVKFKFPRHGANVTLMLEHPVDPARSQTLQPESIPTTGEVDPLPVHPNISSFTFYMSADGPIAIPILVTTGPPDCKIGKGEIAWQYALHTMERRMVPICNESKVQVGMVDCSVAVEKAQSENGSDARRPSMPQGGDFSAWPGTVKLHIKGFQGVQLPNESAVSPTSLVQHHVFLRVQFCGQTHDTAKVNWTLKPAGFSATFSDCLPFDIIRNQPKQIQFQLYVVHPETEELIAMASMYLPNAPQKASHVATQTVALGSGTLSLSHEQLYVKPLREGAAGRPKSAYHRGGAVPKQITSWDSDDEELESVQAAQPAPPPPAPPTSTLALSPTAEFPMKLRNQVEVGRESIEMRCEMDQLKQEVITHRSYIQELVAHVEQMQATILRQQELIERLQQTAVPALDARVTTLERGHGHMAAVPQKAQPNLSNHNNTPSTQHPYQHIEVRGPRSSPLSETTLRLMFQQCDPSSSGFISRDQLRRFYLNHENFGLFEDEQSMDKVLSKYLKTGTRLVSFEEFAQITLRLVQR